MQLIEQILGKKNNVKVLRHLIKHKDWQFNITEMAKDTGINKGVLSRLISELGKENIIKVNSKGKIKLFSVNKENLFIKEVIVPLFEKEDKFYYETLKRFVQKIKDATISIILYGSVASGKARLTSDIDVLVIVNKKDIILEDRINKIKEEFLKNDLLLRVDVLTLNELKKIYNNEEPFVKSIIKNNKTLHGKNFLDLVR
jgi:predicted nucleotidyltransferase